MRMRGREDRSIRARWSTADTGSVDRWSHAVRPARESCRRRLPAPTAHSERPLTSDTSAPDIRHYVVPPEPVAGERLVFSADNGCERLETRVVRLGHGWSGPRSPGERQEILYVTRGTGRLALNGVQHGLEPDVGVLVLPGETYEIDGDIEIVSVLAPVESEIDRQRVVSRFADREEGRADEKRTFRVLHQGELTQFVGIVEPCRAPDHSHPYDEVGYIVEGQGYAHIGEESIPIGPGSFFHLPPQQVHCIENTGPGVMRIMGVFHPAGSPKQRSYGAASE
jgi:quercetin dioxygenase-like cupin family protein